MYIRKFVGNKKLTSTTSMQYRIKLPAETSIIFSIETLYSTEIFYNIPTHFTVACNEHMLDLLHTVCAIPVLLAPLSPRFCKQQVILQLVCTENEQHREKSFVGKYRALFSLLGIQHAALISDMVPCKFVHLKKIFRSRTCLYYRRINF